MDDEHPSPDESVESLKRRVDDAKLRVDFAATHLKEVHSDHRSGDIPAEDRGARAQAVYAKRTARAEYRRVLQIYQDFIARRKGRHANTGT